MERDLKFILLTFVALSVAGCAESEKSAGRGGSGGTPALDSLVAMPRYAVISSDLLNSSSIAMLDENFAVLDESWLNSGTTYPGLVATLSADVVLPNRQAGDGTFAVIDRFLSEFAMVNSFTETHFRSKFQGEVASWPPRIGRRHGI